MLISRGSAYRISGGHDCENEGVNILKIDNLGTAPMLTFPVPVKNEELQEQIKDLMNKQKVVPKIAYVLFPDLELQYIQK